MTINDIEKASKMKTDLREWEGSLYNLRRLLESNIDPKNIEPLSPCDKNIFGKIKLWFDSKGGKHEIQCGQPRMNGLTSGCSVRLEINADQLALFCEFVAQIVDQKKRELMALIESE